MEDIPDILRDVCANKRKEIERIEKGERLELAKRAEGADPPRGFLNALSRENSVSIIAEVKKASPSAGVIAEGFDPAAVARAYQAGGARCTSVLTDEKYFMGNMNHLLSVRNAVSLPILRKDFMLEDIQITQARAYGADCVLLIVAALDDKKLTGLLDCAKKWGMDALVEVHTPGELQRAVLAGAGAIGINNRNLHSFDVDLSVTMELAEEAPDDIVLISESGINDRGDIQRLGGCGIDAVLVGETLMRAQDKEEATRQLCKV